MSIISNDFGRALAQMRNAVSSMSAELQAMRQELDELRRDVDHAHESTVDTLNSTVLRAAASGNQEQLHSLSHQALTPRQAEMVRLAIQSDEAVINNFDLDPEMMARYQASIRARGNPPVVSVPRASINGNAERMQQLSDQLKANAAQASQDIELQKQMQQHVQSIKAKANKQQRNALGGVTLRSTGFDVEDY